MPTVTLATHCHTRDLPRLHAPGELESLIDSHAYPFDEILVTHQRCGDLPYSLPPNRRIRVLNILEEDYPILLSHFGMNPDDARLDEITHGWSWQWYWKHHCVNHLKEILAATSDYIVFSDADCRIQKQPSSWVIEAIKILEAHPDIFVVSPSDGGHEFEYFIDGGVRAVRMTSQQLFVGRHKQLLEMDFTYLQWDGHFISGGPMAEWYGMLEGWLYRYMRKHDLYRAMLPEAWRYWHYEWH